MPRVLGLVPGLTGIKPECNCAGLCPPRGPFDDIRCGLGGILYGAGGLRPADPGPFAFNGICAGYDEVCTAPGRGDAGGGPLREVGLEDCGLPPDLYGRLWFPNSRMAGLTLLPSLKRLGGRTGGASESDSVVEVETESESRTA